MYLSSPSLILNLLLTLKLYSHLTHYTLTAQHAYKHIHLHTQGIAKKLNMDHYNPPPSDGSVLSVSYYIHFHAKNLYTIKTFRNFPKFPVDDLISCLERLPAIVQKSFSCGMTLKFLLILLYPVYANEHTHLQTHAHIYESSFISWLSVLAIFLGGAGLSTSPCSCSLFFAAFFLSHC